MRQRRFPFWRNWNDNFVCRPERLLAPRTTEDVVSIVRDARARERRVRPVGAGYSYTPLVQTDHDLVSLDALSGVWEIDLESGTAVAGPGTRLHQLAAALARHGAALANCGDIDRQSLAGAIATGTHGTGIGIGSISSQIVALTLVNGLGEVVDLQAGRDEAQFRAAAVSLGALGIVTSIRLKIQPLYTLHIQRGAETLEQLLGRLDHHVRSNRNFEFFWFPGDDLTYTKRMNVAPKSAAPFAPARDGVRFLNDIVIENGLLAVACETTRRNQALRGAWLRLGRALVPHDASDLPANRAYTTPRLLRHYEVEYALPAERGAEALAFLDAALRKHPVKTVIPIEVRFSSAEAFPLSPAYGREVMYVAVHAHRAEDYQEYFDLCEAIFLSYDGRPHWGKLHSLRAPELAARYPAWDDFQSVRAAFDPERRFTNGYLARLLGA